MIRHVVALTWVDATTDADVAAVRAGLATLPDQIPEIRAFTFGSDLGVGDGNAHFAIAADFDDVDAWRRYQRHPAHQAVLTERIRPFVAAGPRCSSISVPDRRRGPSRTLGACPPGESSRCPT